MHSSIQQICNYLLNLKQEDLAISSIKVHWAVISAFHPCADNCSVFSNNITIRFCKGLERLYPKLREPIPLWHLNLILSKLMVPPFEPSAMCSLLHLSWNLIFITAISSARRVSQLHSLTSDPPYTVFFKDKVYLCPHPSFLSSVVSWSWFTMIPTLKNN